MPLSVVAAPLIFTQLHASTTSPYHPLLAHLVSTFSLTGRSSTSVNTLCSHAMTHADPSSSSVIHIPATEFPTAHSPPPHPRPKIFSPDRARRRVDADHHRAAALRSVADRCRAHVRHAADVATSVKAKRLAEAQLRHRELTDTLAHANNRRMQHLSRRARTSPQKREKRQRQSQERSSGYHSRLIGRLKAVERRSRILSERRERAARFSPPRSSRMSDSSSSISSTSPVARTLQFDQDPVLPDESILPSSVLQETDAATTIASYYLLSRARHALRASGALGPQLPSYDFGKLTLLMESQSAQDAAELMLRALDLRNPAKRTSPRAATERRILLSSLVIALHPEAVLHRRFKDRNTQEAMTLFCARRMLLCLHVGTLHALSQSWVWWKTSFSAWKKRDAENMLCAMINDAVATEAMRVAVNKGFVQSENVRALRHALGGEPSYDESSRREHAVWEEGIARKQQMLRKSVVKLAGKAGERRLNLALSASRDAQNERMVHEILVDLPALLEDIKNPTPLPDEAWEKLRNELSEDPPGRDALAARLTDISTSLNAMMPDSFDLETVSSPIVLDVDFAVSVVCKASNALKQCQAEAFDDALEEWERNAVTRLQNSEEQFVEVVVDVLIELTKLIRRSHAYVLMYRVRHSVPIVQQYGAAWERAHFHGHIDSGRFSKKLPRTKLLLRHVLRHEGSGSGNARPSEKSACLRLALITGIAKLASETEMRRREELPEILFLDHERIVRIQNDVQRCTLVGSFDNIGRQFLTSRGLTPSTDTRYELLESTEKENTSLQDIKHGFVEWVRKVINQNGKALSEGDIGFLERMVYRTVQAGDKTFDIIHSRVTEAIIEVAVKMASRRMRSASGNAPNDADLNHSRKGLEGTDVLIQSVSSRICSLVLHVLEVHGEMLSEVVDCL